MSLYKIIKAVDVQENLLHVLPLRSCTTLLERENFNYGDNRAAEAGLMKHSAVQADEIVSLAHVSADEIITQARSAARQIKEEAYRSAFEKGQQEGYNTGYHDAMAKAEEEAAAIRAQAAEVMEQAEKLRRQTLETMEREIVDLARAIAEKLLSAQLSLEPGMVIKVAEESLRLVSDRLNLVLYVNPLELELVENRKGFLLEVLPARAKLQVITDPAIQTGGCKIETEQGWVDATMETRLKELIKVLYGSQ